MDLKAWTEAQRAVIGSLLLDPDQAAGEVFQRAKPQHFSDPALRHVFEAARRIWEENRPIDPVTVLAATGNDYYETLKGAMEMTPTAANVVPWLEICRDCARLSAMQGEALAIINAENVQDAMAAYERMGRELQDAGGVKRMSIQALISDYLDRMHDKKPVRYLSWGIESLDKTLYVSRGQFGVLAADSSSGKTALALQFAYHMASTGLRVGFISLETPWDSIEDRLLAEKQVAGIPLPSSKKKTLQDDDFRRAGEAAMKADRMKLEVFRDCYTLPEIRATIIQNRLDVCLIDYVQLIDAPGRERWDIVTNISMGLHRMAQQLGVVVIGLSQVTPAAKGANVTPTKDDLRESRQLKQDADFILLLYPDRDDDAPPNGRVLEVAKNKDGRLARLRLQFEPEHMTFGYMPSVSAMRGQGKIQKGRKPTKAAEDPEGVKPGELREIQDDGQEDLPF